MTVYVVAGASRGIGYAFLRHLSHLPSTTVIGLARRPDAVTSQIQTDITFPPNALNNGTLHILKGDMTDRADLATAVDQICQITSSDLFPNGVVDIVINNGAFTGKHAAFVSLSSFSSDSSYLEGGAILEHELLTTFQTNVVGVVNTINALLPLIRNSTTDVPKVITLSSDLANDNLTNDYGVYENGPYSISKAAVNTVIAKYNAELGIGPEVVWKSEEGGKGKGILFTAIHPGIVATVNDAIPPPDSDKPRKFRLAYPDHFGKSGPLSPDDSVKNMMKLIEGMELTEEYAGRFLTHYGGTKWAF